LISITDITIDTNAGNLKCFTISYNVSFLNEIVQFNLHLFDIAIFFVCE